MFIKALPIVLLCSLPVFAMEKEESSALTSLASTVLITEKLNPDSSANVFEEIKTKIESKKRSIVGIDKDLLEHRTAESKFLKELQELPALETKANEDYHKKIMLNAQCLFEEFKKRNAEEIIKKKQGIEAQLDTTRSEGKELEETRAIINSEITELQKKIESQNTGFLAWFFSKK